MHHNEAPDHHLVGCVNAQRPCAWSEIADGERLQLLGLVRSLYIPSGIQDVHSIRFHGDQGFHLTCHRTIHESYPFTIRRTLQRLFRNIGHKTISLGKAGQAKDRTKNKHTSAKQDPHGPLYGIWTCRFRSIHRYDLSTVTTITCFRTAVTIFVA